MSAEILLSLNAQAGIDKTVLVQAYSAYKYDNRYTADCAASYPGHFASMIILNPLEHDTPDNLSYWVRERGMRGLRLFTTTETEGTLARRPANLSGLGTRRLPWYPDLHNGAVPSTSARARSNLGWLPLSFMSAPEGGQSVGTPYECPDCAPAYPNKKLHRKGTPATAA